MKHFVIFVFLLLNSITDFASGNELSRCCSGGSRHFLQTSTCSNIKSEGTSLTCVRAASICCLRALLDDACDDGAQLARQDDTCHTNINVLGGGLRKECCDCCLLAKDLIKRNEPCIPPTGFSAACLKAFSKCCSGTFEFSHPHNLRTEKPSMSDGEAVLELGDRCSTAKCDHLCNDRGGDSVECSCRVGYELGPDGTTCVDIDECSSRTPPCQWGMEECVNTDGGYECEKRNLYDNRRIIRMRDESRRRVSTNAQRHQDLLMRDAPARPSSHYSSRHFDPQTHHKGWPCNKGYSLQNGICRDINECLDNPCPFTIPLCLNIPGTFSCVCQTGYYYSEVHRKCLDVDECLLLVDDCLESQRCLNTPGSFKCIRTLSCGTGYAMDSESEQCIDVDECNLGAHDCGVLYQCRNTQGSYRCDPKKCGEGELQNPQTGECTSIECPLGFYPKNGMCNDVDECAEANRCGPAEQCINTPGSYRCQEMGNMCAEGYQTNRNTGFCEDIDECMQNACGSLQCINMPGSYKCRCPAGYDFDEKLKKCEDINECEKFAGHVCDLSAECRNTIGSFICKCKAGFQLAADGRRCEDVNECDNGQARCEQKCVNIPGSYQCICDRGFALGSDGITCQDIDECSIWAGSGNDLCMGGCINTRGSYLCQCPPGYKIQADGRTCVDIDECQLGECQGNDRICVNTLGQFKCNRIECPHNYIHDSSYKNRCNRDKSICEGIDDVTCKGNYPVHYTWQFIAIPRAVPISSHRPSITLFTIKGPSSHDSLVQFELQLKKAVTGSHGISPAIRPNFLLQKGKDRNSVVVALRDSLDGPQDVELELTLRLTKNGQFSGKFVAILVVNIQDGYSCLKNCSSIEDAACIANSTREILYQFRAIPSLTVLKHPLEISRIRAHMEIPFSVEYILDARSQRYFNVEQDRNIGIVRLTRPIEGPTLQTVRVNIHTKSRRGVILSYNVAIIEIYISKFNF